MFFFKFLLQNLFYFIAHETTLLRAKRATHVVTTATCQQQRAARLQLLQQCITGELLYTIYDTVN